MHMYMYMYICMHNSTFYGFSLLSSDVSCLPGTPSKQSKAVSTDGSSSVQRAGVRLEGVILVKSLTSIQQLPCSWKVVYVWSWEEKRERERERERASDIHNKLYWQRNSCYIKLPQPGINNAINIMLLHCHLHGLIKYKNVLNPPHTLPGSKTLINDNKEC